MADRFPNNFLAIIGAPKSGTSSVANWLSARPDMALEASKEPRFHTDFADRTWNGPKGAEFADSIRATLDDYADGFAHKPDADWAVDASTDYLWCPASPAKLKDWSASHPTKIICILRDPVQRALSEYQHSLRDLYQSDSFEKSLQLEGERFEKSWHPIFYHRRRSTYFENVSAYKEIFGDDMLILDYKDIRAQDDCLRRIEAFLGVGPFEIGEQPRLNQSFSYSSPGAGKLIRSQKLIKAARAIVPKRFRSSIRGAVEKKVVTQFEPSAQEIAMITDLLADDIAACVASPLIPTDNWTCTAAREVA
jgi:hypothetical protein